MTSRDLENCLQFLRRPRPPYILLVGETFKRPALFSPPCYSYGEMAKIVFRTAIIYLLTHLTDYDIDTQLIRHEVRLTNSCISDTSLFSQQIPWKTLKN